jgi:hypothetical protein
MGLISLFSCLPCCAVPISDRELPRVIDQPVVSDALSPADDDALVFPAHLRAIPRRERDARFARLRCVCLSDVHARHERVEIPRGDVLIFAGDVTRHRSSAQDVRAFVQWAAALPGFRHKLVVSGNHEVCLDAGDVDASVALFAPLQYLQDTSVHIEARSANEAEHHLDAHSPASAERSIHFYGTPWRTARGCCYRAEAFGASPPVLRERRAAIPAGVHVLITHQPPFGVRDLEDVGHIGCPDLLDALERVRPLAHVFGHVHECRGASALAWPAASGDGGGADADALAAESSTACLNVAILNDEVNLYRPIVFDVYAVPATASQLDDVNVQI